MRPSIFSILLAMAVLASCDAEEGRLTGTWQGRRFETDVWTLTIDDSHGRLSGTYRIQWDEEPSEVSGSLTGSSLATTRDFLDVWIEFNVEIAAGTATCRYNARLRDEVVLSGETVCVRDAREFQVGHLGLRRQ